MSSRGARVGRGLVAAAVAILVAALFHMAGGGIAPSPQALGLALAFAGLACIALAGRRMSLWRLSLSVGVSQFLFHTLFSLTVAHGAGRIDAAGHLHAGMHLVLPTLPGGSAVALTDGPSMWISHAVAAAITIVVLRTGERAFWAVCAFTWFRLRFRLLIAGLAVTPLAVPARSIIDSVPLMLPSREVVLGRLRHRGPPLLGEAIC